LWATPAVVAISTSVKIMNALPAWVLNPLLGSIAPPSTYLFPTKTSKKKIDSSLSTYVSFLLAFGTLLCSNHLKSRIVSFSLATYVEN
jgi:hypothetical protein